jgi:DNA polymerase
MKTKQSQLNTLKISMQSANLLLKQTANHLVFGEGSPDAKIFFVGEAPGKNEDLQGLPFIGSAGKVLDQLLLSIDLQRSDIYITSILKYRPPSNRNPSVEEIIDHTPYLVDQIRIIKPKILVPLGNFATRFILNGFSVDGMQKIPGISNLHGKIEEMSFEKLTFLVIALYHPAAVLYNPPLRQTLHKDFKIVQKALQNKTKGSSS